MPEPRASVAPASPGALVTRAVELIGDWAAFSASALAWTLRRRPGPGTLVPVCYAVGVRSVLVVPLLGPERPYGLLVACSERTPLFLEDELHFLGILLRLNLLFNAALDGSRQGDVSDKDVLH